MSMEPIGIIGASSPLALRLIEACRQYQRPAVAFSRSPASDAESIYPLSDIALHGKSIKRWIWVAPAWTFSEWRGHMGNIPMQRAVFLSSTSASTKQESSEPAERETSRKLVEGERSIEQWCENHDVNWCILRTTLIYGHGDRNISEIQRIIAKAGVFPLVGHARGLRQPLHVDDLAHACLAILDHNEPYRRRAIITGGETLPYREMVHRIYTAQGLPPRSLHIPLWLARLLLNGLRLLPRYRHWNTAMLERMNRDLAFESDPAIDLLNIHRRRFDPVATRTQG